MKKSTEKRHPLASYEKPVQNDPVGLEEKPSPHDVADSGVGKEMGATGTSAQLLRQDAPLTWSWPTRAGTQDPKKYVLGDWGCVYFYSAPPDEATDVRIEFDTKSIPARSQAFEFAKALIARLQTEQPGMRARFYPADDHYQVIVEDFGSPERKLAAGIFDVFFGTTGVLSGKRAGSTFTHERHERRERHIARRRRFDRVK